MKLDSSEMNSNLSFRDGNLNKKGSDVKLVELFIFQALDKVRKPKHKLYFHSYEHTIHHSDTTECIGIYTTSMLS